MLLQVKASPIWQNDGEKETKKVSLLHEWMNQWMTNESSLNSWKNSLSPVKIFEWLHSSYFSIFWLLSSLTTTRVHFKTRTVANLDISMLSRLKCSSKSHTRKKRMKRIFFSFKIHLKNFLFALLDPTRFASKTLNIPLSEMLQKGI